MLSKRNVVRDVRFERREVVLCVCLTGEGSSPALVPEEKRKKCSSSKIAFFQREKPLSLLLSQSNRQEKEQRH